MSVITPLHDTTETTETSEAFDALVTTVTTWARTQVITSQSRCVDALLDLWNATESHSARAIVAETLSDIRHLSAVEGQLLADRAALVRLAAAVDSAFDHYGLG